jgi:hypothetical protein
MLWINKISVLHKLDLINSKNWGMLHELNVKEPYYFTMRGFCMMQISVRMERQTKCALLGYSKSMCSVKKIHYAAKITVWASLLSHCTIKLLFLKNL